MSLLAEYALTPDVFDSTAYTSEEVGDLRIQQLRQVFLDEAIVRNLRDGEWLNVFGGTNRPWHRRGKELLKKLVSQGRLRLVAPRLPGTPTDDCGWCREAIASHAVLPLDGILVTDIVAVQFSENTLVAPMTKLSSVPWWANRSSSVRLGRTMAEYQRHLERLLQCANSLMFIDAHFDPSQGRYKDFISILCTIGGRTPAPQIELHRVCYLDSHDRRPDPALKDRFVRNMAGPLNAAGLAAEVFFWDDFHDRHVISDLIGLSMQNGFDTTTNPQARTTWHRLSRGDRDDIQREFDPASKRHTLVDRFSIA